jgi:hypothetical protein
LKILFHGVLQRCRAYGVCDENPFAPFRAFRGQSNAVESAQWTLNESITHSIRWIVMLNDSAYVGSAIGATSL